MTYEQIVSSLLQYVHTNYSTTAVRFPWTAGTPGDDFDTSAAEWIAIEILDFLRGAQRSSDQTVRPLLQVSVFTKRSSNLWRQEEIVGAVRALLEYACISVQDFATGGEPEVAKMRLREAQIVDLGEERPGSDLNHVSITFGGRVETTS